MIRLDTLFDEIVRQTGQPRGHKINCFNGTERDHRRIAAGHRQPQPS